MLDRRSNSRLRQGAQFTAVFFALFALVVTALLFTTYSSELTKFESSLRRLSPEALSLVFFLSLTNFFLRAVRWYWYARQIGIRSSFGTSLSHYIAGFAMGVTPGRIGEAIRIWLLKQDCLVPYNRGFSLLVADRINDLLAIAILTFGSSLATTGSATDGMIVSVALGAMIYVAMRHPRWIMYFVTRLYTLVGRFDRVFAGLRRSLRIGADLFSLKNTLVVAPLSFLAWFAECIGFFVILTAFDADVTLSTATFIYLFSTLVGAISFLPGGVGGFEASAILLLGMSGLDTSTSIIAVSIIRLATLWFSVVLGWLFIGRLILSKRAIP
jgi:uncharacterized protein (TIRG00374 family)